MSDEAAYLVDMVLPEAPYRQWTLTFSADVLEAPSVKPCRASLHIQRFRPPSIQVLSGT